MCLPPSGRLLSKIRYPLPLEMKVSELREKFLRFFEEHGHTAYPSGSLIPYDVTGRLDESLLFNGAGMVQFKPYFRGIAQPSNPRLTTVQKCVRTGDIEEVGDLSHLSFFEMLGNFSFGDYFKKEAIDLSWKFLTSPEWLGLDPKRLSFTVFEEDNEAFACWSEHVASVGIDPNSRVFRLGEDTNYWPAGSFSAGPPGPCGPNSEMFYWVEGEPPAHGPGGYSRDQWLADDAAKKWLEIWNDVFIQYEWQGELRNPERPDQGYVKRAMPNLPFKSIDTGMGLERTAAVLGGLKSVYDTDAFQPILKKLESMMPGLNYGADDKADHAMRVIADHLRTAVFCIGDGILPGNNGRGYVLRRLIRRAILKGTRTLGFDRLFLYEVFPGLLESMGRFYVELHERRAVIEETLKNEEQLFKRTLASGTTLLQEELAQLGGEKTLPGDIAFRLYDTFGFPLEVTRELCAEEGVEVDLGGYEASMLKAQELSRAAGGMETVYGGVALNWGTTPTQFTGYESVTGEAVAIVVHAIGEDTLGVAFDKTPFYANSGGQVGDQGEIRLGERSFRVSDVSKHEGVFVHHVVAPGIEPGQWVGKTFELQVDGERRAKIKRNHSATHLLHAALRRHLGTHVTQAGSYVGPDRLRFDFTHGKAVTAQEWAFIEQDVNAHVLVNDAVTTYVDLPISEAKAKGAMALFGEKYGDKVRMVEIGESKELCGGIHVKSSAEVGLFRILSEASAASGIRRIEAVTGEGAYEWATDQSHMVRVAADMLKAQPKDLLGAIERNLETIKELNRKLDKLKRQSLGNQAPELSNVGPFELAVLKLNEGERQDATLAVEGIVNNHPNRVALVALVSGDSIIFVAKAGSEAVAKGAHAGNLVREVAKVTGGNGGGKPDFASAGGKDVAKVDEALSMVADFLKGVLA